MIGELSAMEIDSGTKVGVGGSREVEVDRIKVAKVEIAKIESQTANWLFHSLNALSNNSYKTQYEIQTQQKLLLDWC